MAPASMALTDYVVRAAEPGAKPVKLFDGGGMFLIVMPRGGKWWRFKYRFNGKENQVSLGVFPTVSLADARLKRDELRRLLSSGVDPSEHVRRSREMRHTASEPAPTHAVRLSITDGGALVIQRGKREIHLTASQTSHLRAFLDATRRVGSSGASSCP